MRVYTVEKTGKAVLNMTLGVLIPEPSKAILVETFATKRAYKKWARSVF